jgi:hypothetical protein
MWGKRNYLIKPTTYPCSIELPMANKNDTLAARMIA